MKNGKKRKIWLCVMVFAIFCLTGCGSTEQRRTVRIGHNQSTNHQSNIIDGAENNEMALTDNGHGDVCKYYSYDMHQMVPDILIVNDAFIHDLTEEEREIFEEGYELLNQVQRKEWGKAVEAAKDKAENQQHVRFLYPDQEPFVEACKPLHESVLAGNPELQPIYDKIQEYNEQDPSVAE